MVNMCSPSGLKMAEREDSKLASRFPFRSHSPASLFTDAVSTLCPFGEKLAATISSRYVDKRMPRESHSLAVPSLDVVSIVLPSAEAATDMRRSACSIKLRFSVPSAAFQTSTASRDTAMSRSVCGKNVMSSYWTPGLPSVFVSFFVTSPQSVTHPSAPVGTSA